MRQRVLSAAVFMVAVSMSMAGCGGDDSPPWDAGSTPSLWRPTGSPVTIEPLGKIAGAEVYESDGISVLVPDGWETRRTETSDYVKIYVLRPDDERNPVGVTIFAEPGNADTVDSMAAVVSADVAMNGGTEMEQRPATWSGWKYASAVTGVFDQGEDGVVASFLQVVALSGEGKVVGVSAQAPRGKLDDALSYQVLRSVKPVE